MWEININLQLLFFLRSAVLGMVYCLLYDILRAARRVISYSDIGVSLQDFFYFLIITPATFIFLLAATNGEIRFYVLFAIGLGFLACRLTFSRLFVPFLKGLLSLLFKVFSVIFSFIRGIFSKTCRFIEKIFKKAKKLLKKA